MIRKNKGAAPMVNVKIILSDEYVNMIKELEGFKSTAYKCSAGTITIGYGHSEHIDSLALHTPSISEEDATVILEQDLLRFASAVNDAVKVQLTDNQFAALTFFCFNIGESAFKKSTLVRLLNQGDYDSVPGQMLRWNKIKGVPSIGLTHRRQKEIALWQKGSSDDAYSGFQATPHSDRLLPHKEFAASASTVALGALADSTGNGILQYTFALLLLIAFIYFLVVYRKKLANLW